MASMMEVDRLVGRDSRGALDSNASRVSVRYTDAALGTVQHARDLQATVLSRSFGAYHYGEEGGIRSCGIKQASVFDARCAAASSSQSACGNGLFRSGDSRPKKLANIEFAFDDGSTEWKLLLCRWKKRSLGVMRCSVHTCIGTKSYRGEDKIKNQN